jgi:putative toxin-antitoxin system antitoxin component (TIGR02293 family)
MSHYGSPLLVKTFLPVDPCQDKSLLKEQYQGPTTPLVERLRKGLPLAEFHALRTLLDIPEEELGRLLGMSPATLNRRKKGSHHTTAESERIVRFARLFGLACEVLEAEDAARDWLKTENPGTAHEPPLAYADTEFGAREVENLLGRLDHGIF